jgi:manganese/zinc/iron transport system substrate-binding protein
MINHVTRFLPIRKPSVLLLALLALLPWAAGCDDRSGGATPAQSAQKKPKVATTTTMIGDLARRIGGDRIDLAVIMPPGTDPHTFKPSTGDIGRLAAADRIFYNGLHLEGKMVETFEEKLKGKAIPVAEAIPTEKLLSWQEGRGGAYDPHVWFDVKLWALAAQKVAADLASADPPGAEDYRRRGGELVKGLDALDDYARTQLAAIPQERRVLVTSHDAYGYFGRAYAVEVRGLQGISTETEAGIQAINAAVDYIIAKKIPALFVESSVSPKTIQRVQSDCRARGFEVKIGGELYSDAMGQPGEHPGYEVHTYEGMIRYNVDTIVKALK